jgi:predicted transcriptional regulator
MRAIGGNIYLHNHYGEISAYCHEYSETELYQAIHAGLDQIKNGEIITEEEMMKNLNSYIGK